MVFSTDIWMYISKYVQNLDTLLSLRLVYSQSRIEPLPQHLLKHLQLKTKLRHVGENTILKHIPFLMGYGNNTTQDHADITFLAAVKNNWLNVLRYVKDYSPNARIDDNSALRYAAEHNYVDVLKLLRNEFGLTADDARSRYNYAFQVAIENDHMDVLLCLKYDFNLTIDDARDDDNYALRSGAAYGNVDVLKFLRSEYNLTADDARAQDNAALWRAATYGYVETLRYLKTGYNLTSDDARAGNNRALKSAIKNKHVDVVKFLAEEFNVTE